MKGAGSDLMPIVEVPSEAGESNNTDLDQEIQDLQDQRSNGQDLYPSDGDPSPFQSEDDEVYAEERLEQTARSTSRNNTHTGKRAGRKGTQHVDMTPPQELLEDAENKAKKCVVKKKESQAIEELIRCTALARIVHGSNHWKLAKTHADLATAYYDLKGYAPQAEYHAEHARNIIKSVQMTSSSGDKPKILEIVISIYYTLGRAQAQQKKYQPAGESLSKAEEVNRQRANISGVKSKESDNWDMKISLSMAKLKARQKAQGQAVSYYERALDIMEKLLGLDAAELIPVYQGLGRVEQSKGDLADHEKAIHYFQQAHEISSKRDRHGGVEVGDTAVCLAEAYSNVGNTEAELSAESYFNDALAIYQLHFGPHHEKTISVQDSLGRLQIRAEKQDEGIETLKASIGPKKELYGELSAPVAETWKLIGNVHLAQQDMEKAMRTLKKCHNIETSLYGANHKKTKDTQRTLDILMANPSLSKHKIKSKAEEMKERPRFNSIVKRDSRHGGTKTDTY